MTSMLSSYHPFHKVCIHMRNKRPHKLHLFPRVFEYNTRVFRFTAKAVGRHHHSKIVYIHFCNRNILRSSKNLQENKTHIWHHCRYSNCLLFYKLAVEKQLHTGLKNYAMRRILPVADFIFVKGVASKGQGSKGNKGLRIFAIYIP